MIRQKRAERLLRQRDTGVSYRGFLVSAWRRYLLSLTIVVILATLSLHWFKTQGPAWAIVGLYMGVFFRDYGWIRTVKAGWGFTSEVIDWSKVQTIAKGGDPGGASVGHDSGPAGA